MFINIKSHLFYFTSLFENFKLERFLSISLYQLGSETTHEPQYNHHSCHLQLRHPVSFTQVFHVCWKVNTFQLLFPAPVSSPHWFILVVISKVHANVKTRERLQLQSDDCAKIRTVLRDAAQLHFDFCQLSSNPDLTIWGMRNWNVFRTFPLSRTDNITDFKKNLSKDEKKIRNFSFAEENIPVNALFSFRRTFVPRNFTPIRPWFFQLRQIRDILFLSLASRSQGPSRFRDPFKALFTLTISSSYSEH